MKIFGEALGVYGPEGTLGVNDKEATESDALVLDEDAVVARNGHVPVSDQGELEVRPEAALLARLGGPGEVGEVRVG